MKVDVTVERELSKRFDIKGVPTLYLFTEDKKKNPIQYKGTIEAQKKERKKERFHIYIHECRET